MCFTIGKPPGKSHRNKYPRKIQLYFSNGNQNHLKCNHCLLGKMFSFIIFQIVIRDKEFNQ